MKIKIPKRELMDEECRFITVKIIDDKMVEQRRWSIVHKIIFEYNEKFYEAYYDEGATEMQDEDPWEYEDFVEATEVHEVEKTIKVWEAI